MSECHCTHIEAKLIQVQSFTLYNLWIALCMSQEAAASRSRAAFPPVFCQNACLIAWPVPLIGFQSLLLGAGPVWPFLIQSLALGAECPGPASPNVDEYRELGRHGAASCNLRCWGRRCHGPTFYVASSTFASQVFGISLHWLWIVLSSWRN